LTSLAWTLASSFSCWTFNRFFNSSIWFHAFLIARQPVALSSREKRNGNSPVVCVVPSMRDRSYVSYSQRASSLLSVEELHSPFHCTCRMYLQPWDSDERCTKFHSGRERGN
jgi:hypothetical protein